MSAYNFGGSGRNLTKLYQGTWPEARVIKWTLILQGVPPTKFGRAKNVRNSSRFLTTFDFDREYLRNGSTSKIRKVLDQLHFISDWAEKNW